MKLDTNPNSYPNKTHLEQLSNASNGIHVCAKVVENMLVERTLEDCPDWCESDYILGGLIDAIGELSHSVSNFSEREKDIPEGQEKWVEVNADKATNLPLIEEPMDPLSGAEERKSKLGF